MRGKKKRSQEISGVQSLMMFHLIPPGLQLPFRFSNELLIHLAVPSLVQQHAQGLSVPARSVAGQGLGTLLQCLRGSIFHLGQKP